MGHRKGLLLAKTRIEVEDFSPRWSATCCVCEEPIEGNRLKVSKGGGRFGKTELYCEDCGWEYLDELQTNIENAKQRLLGDDIKAKG